jgi:hypothetical protein
MPCSCTAIAREKCGLSVQQVLNEKKIGSFVIVSIKIKLYLDFNGQFQYMFLRMIASKKVYFAQLRSQKTFYELVEDKFLIIFIGAGVKLPALKGGACGEQSGQLSK